jgi:PAS domain-containing protein
MHEVPLTSYFAFPERASHEQTASESSHVRAQPLVKILLDGFPERIVILNRHRQIVLANEKLATLLNRSAESLVGQRPGEALKCIHRAEEAGGCGTSRFCRLCGAVNAIVNCQRSGVTNVEECRLTLESPQGPVSLDVRVWTMPFQVGDSYTLFAVRDISDEKRRAVLERIFFHDILNSAGGLRGLVEMIPDLRKAEALEICGLAFNVADELIEEIESGRDLAAAKRGELSVQVGPTDRVKMLEGICSLYRRHSVGHMKEVVIRKMAGQCIIATDRRLLRRVLGNMLKNALVFSRRGCEPGIHEPGRRPDYRAQRVCDARGCQASGLSTLVQYQRRKGSGHRNLQHWALV